MAARRRVAWGFSVHTGWAALVAVSGNAVVDRRRVEMIANGELERPRFAYHAAAKLNLRAAERLVRECATLALANALRELEAASRERTVAIAAVIAGDRPLTRSLEEILQSHPLLHSAEGELFRGAIRAASEALGVPVVAVRRSELLARLSDRRVAAQLAEIGRAAGRPWARDQREACLAALMALAE